MEKQSDACIKAAEIYAESVAEHKTWLASATHGGEALPPLWVAWLGFLNLPQQNRRRHADD